MKPMILIAAAFGLATAAPVSTLYKRMPVDNLLRLSMASFPDQAVRDTYASDVSSKWRLYPLARLEWMALLYGIKLLDYVNKGQDETASNIVLTLSESGNDEKYPVTKDDMNSFLDKVSDMIAQEQAKSLP
ncbi:uncharacterized protein UV8b_03432 [Ustilaginoidea virens]|nr:uncharacterized protein UV8b_03432 [Ustilaginoidea virens]QUC19191.1 hypothetical protein UV8b_03432 [Ustilaginoidea virens]